MSVWDPQMTSHLLLIVFEFSHSMGVHKDNCSCVSGVCDCPSSINMNLFRIFAAASPGVKADIEVAKGLCVSVFRFKGIIAGENFVEINVAVNDVKSISLLRVQILLGKGVITIV